MWCRGHFYPGTGAVHEVGKGAGEGFTVNIPWPMGGMGNGDYMAAFSHVIIPIAHEYSPDLIIISAGFDASAGDPIGGCASLPAVISSMLFDIWNQTESLKCFHSDQG
jgi:histone deacetylase 6